MTASQEARHGVHQRLSLIFRGKYNLFTSAAISKEILASKYTLPRGWRAQIPAINSALLASIFFLVPTKIALAYALSVVMLVLWIAEGDWESKWFTLRANPVFWILQTYFWLFVLSLAWTSDQSSGRTMATRYVLFVVAAIYFTVARREHTSRYLAAFAAGVVMCELFAGYNWIRIYQYPHWPQGFQSSKDVLEIAPFVDRIMFGPIVAFTGYVSGWRALGLRGSARFGWGLVWLSTLFSLSISAGRTGMASFSLMMGLLTLQLLPHHRVRAVLTASLVTALSALTLFLMGDLQTQRRVADGVAEVHDLGRTTATSLAQRSTMTANTLRIIAEQPGLGVGAGDFRSAYQKMNERFTPAERVTRNPHNEMLFAVATTGLIGGLVLFIVWFVPPWIFRHSDDGLGCLRLALPTFFLIICFAESYLWLPNTGLMFVLFSSLLYGPASPKYASTELQKSNPKSQP